MSAAFPRRSSLALMLGAAIACASGAARAAPADAAKTGPQVVTVGAYFYFVRNLDLRANSYTADFYVWFLWSGDINPTKSFEFMNALGTPQVRPVFQNDAGADTPETMPDGRKLQQYHVQGSFGHTFNLSRYPLDEQELSVEIEDIKADPKEMVYRIDETGTQAHDALSIPGWSVRSAKGMTRTTKYRTTFGDSRQQGGSNSPNATFVLRIGRPAVRTVFESIAPLLFTMLVAFAAFFTNAHEFGARLSIFATAVIAVVFLHLAYAYDVPPGTISLVSEMHVLCYVLLLAASLLAVRSMKVAVTDEHAAKTLDHRCFIGLSAAFAAGITGIIALG